MIINALAARAAQNVVGYAIKPLGFSLRVNEDLSGCSLLPLATTENGKLVQRNELIPNLTRSNNPPPLLACDTKQFVIGMPKSDRNPIRQEKLNTDALNKHTKFVKLIEAWYNSSGDNDARAYLEWCKNGKPGIAEAVESLDATSQKRLDTDPIAISVQYADGSSSDWLHNKPTAKAFWKHHINPYASNDRVQEICLACGQLCTPVKSLPQSLIGRTVPGATQSQVALASANFDSVGRSGTAGKQLKSSPICQQCATSAVQAFNELAADKDHRWGTFYDNSAIIWWLKSADKNVEASLFALDNPEPAHIKSLLRSVHTDSPGVERDLELNRFYALEFSGNVARLVIRNWIDVPLQAIEKNLRIWFSNTAILDADKPNPSISSLASCLGTLTKKEGKWLELPPHGTYNLLLRTALIGVQLPPGLLTKALSRARAEIHYQNSDDSLTKHVAEKRALARLALIRFMYNHSYSKENTLPQYLDDSRDDKAYLSGRLFAVRQRLQYLASGNVNASIVDRYFARTSLNPASTENTLSTLAQQHLRSLRRKGKDAAAIAIDSKIVELQSRCGDSPGHLTNEEQAAWIAGYYQQRADDFQKGKDHNTSKTNNTQGHIQD